MNLQSKALLGLALHPIHLFNTVSAQIKGLLGKYDTCCGLAVELMRIILDKAGPALTFTVCVTGQVYARNGIAEIASPLEEAVAEELGECEGLVVRVRGDGQPYSIVLTTGKFHTARLAVSTCDTLLKESLLCSPTIVSCKAEFRTSGLCSNGTISCALRHTRTPLNILINFDQNINSSDQVLLRSLVFFVFTIVFYQKGNFHLYLSPWHVLYK